MVGNPRLREEIIEFIRFFLAYIKSRLINWYVRFEKGKDVLVAILVVRRGKYSQSFLNTSFFLLVASAVIAGPTIAENNPFLSSYIPAEQEASQSVIDTDIYSLPVDTTISRKPRDRVISYNVESGDTLASISKKFDISVDSIKWASGLKSDTIKPGQAIKIPPVTGIVHKVSSGESIYSIAKKYKTDPQQIANFPFNEFVDIDTFALTPGQTLYVPEGVIQAAPARIRLRGPAIAAGTPGTGNFIWPTSGNISQNPIWYHMAVDIANKGLPPVLAADTGTVSYAGCLRYGYGCHIIINHSNGYQTLYGHLSSIGVSAGQGIGRGQQIGNVGSTGRSTGPHLHFEVRSGGRLVNPLGFLK